VGAILPFVAALQEVAMRDEFARQRVVKAFCTPFCQVRWLFFLQLGLEASFF
jgi:hypothetical protein